MLKKVIFGILVLQVFLFAEFKHIDAKQMLELYKNGTPLIDIRTPAEWNETGVIPGSTKIMFFDQNGNYNIKKFMSEFTKVVKDTNQSFVLICRSANRTKTVGNFLDKELGYKHTNDFEGGISKWIEEGGKTVK